MHGRRQRIMKIRRIAKKTDWLNVLKGCPVKMDDLPLRRREYLKRLKL
jgi:hypothetical protein